MGLLKGLIWSALCIGLGIFLATHSFEGRTAVEHAERAVKGDVAEAIEGAKKKLIAKEPPVEKHTLEDKEAVNKLIAGRKPLPARGEGR